MGGFVSRLNYATKPLDGALFQIEAAIFGRKDYQKLVAIDGQDFGNDITNAVRAFYAEHLTKDCDLEKLCALIATQ